MILSRRRWRPRHGINLAGYFLAESGVGEHVRTMLAVLDEARIPVAPLLFGETRSRQQTAIPHLEWTAPVFPVTLACVNADQTPLFFERHPEAREGRYTIGYWHWEVEEFPDSMAASAAWVDEVWTASHHSAASIARKVRVPVRVVPPAVAPPRATPPPADLMPPGEGLLFLCSFDFDSVVARKNPQGAIEAFRRAFPEPRGGHRLLVKSVNGHLFPKERRELEQLAGDRPDVHLVDGFLDRPQQEGLIQACDVYVSLHRAEGFGLMLAEAMAAGKVVIATAYSGNLEFSSDATSLLVPWSAAEIPPGSGPYSGRWAEPDLEAAAAAMARAALTPGELRARVRAARRSIREQHSPRARRRDVKKRLAEISRCGARTLDPRLQRGGTRAAESVAPLASLRQMIQNLASPAERNPRRHLLRLAALRRAARSTW